LPGLPVPAFANNVVVAHDDATHARIGLGGEQAAPGQGKRTAHVTWIGCPGHRPNIPSREPPCRQASAQRQNGGFYGLFRLSPPSSDNCFSSSAGRSRSSFSISSRKACTSSNLRYTEAKRT